MTDQHLPDCASLTNDEINALPERVRKYIHDIETRCDPAGDVAALALVRDQNRALETVNAMMRERIEELEAENRQLRDWQRRALVELKGLRALWDREGFLLSTWRLNELIAEAEVRGAQGVDHP